MEPFSLMRLFKKMFEFSQLDQYFWSYKNPNLFLCDAMNNFINYNYIRNL
jgi:hypothetical protein